MATRRALHFVFKIADRNSTIKFYREILGMKVRIFKLSNINTGLHNYVCRYSGTKNSMKDARLLAMGTKYIKGIFLLCTLFYRPYDGIWSKSMIGYGAEDDHVVVELTYNYGIKSYNRGNDFQVSYLEW